MRRRTLLKNAIEFDRENPLTLEFVEPGVIGIDYNPIYKESGYVCKCKSSLGSVREITTSIKLNVSAGERLSFASDTFYDWNEDNYEGQAVISFYGGNDSARFKASGDITTIYAEGTDLSKIPYAFANMFESSYVVDAHLLVFPNVISEYMYSYMFEWCTYLTTAAFALPVTELVEGCYSTMFEECSNLVSAPIIRATKLARYCCEYMFSNCKSLATAPTLLATTLVDGCYQYMFHECKNLTYIEVNFTDYNKCCNSWVSGVPDKGWLCVPPGSYNSILNSVDKGNKKPDGWGITRYSKNSLILNIRNTDWLFAMDDPGKVDAMDSTAEMYYYICDIVIGGVTGQTYRIFQPNCDKYYIAQRETVPIVGQIDYRI